MGLSQLTGRLKIKIIIKKTKKVKKIKNNYCILEKVVVYLSSCDVPACRNGRRGRLKICCGQPRAGSSPAAGTTNFSEIKVFEIYFEHW